MFWGVRWSGTNSSTKILEYQTLLKRERRLGSSARSAKRAHDSSSRVMNSSPTLGMEFTLKKEEKRKNSSATHLWQDPPYRKEVMSVFSPHCSLPRLAGAGQPTSAIPPRLAETSSPSSEFCARTHRVCLCVC